MFTISLNTIGFIPYLWSNSESTRQDLHPLLWFVGPSDEGPGALIKDIVKHGGSERYLDWMSGSVEDIIGKLAELIFVSTKFGNVYE